MLAADLRSALVALGICLGVAADSAAHMAVNISGRIVRYRAPAELARMGPLIIGVLSADAAARETVRLTWGRGQHVLFVVASPTRAVRAEFSAARDLLVLDMDEEYNARSGYSVLPYKTQAFLHAVDRLAGAFDYVFKTDDDCAVHVPRLRDALAAARPDYWGRRNRNPKPNRNPLDKAFVSRAAFGRERYPDYCSGGGYALSREFVRCAVGALAEHDFLPIEDAATGLLAERCGVALARTQRMQMKRAGRCRPDDIVCHPYKTCAAMAAAWQSLEPEAARAVECP